MAAISTAAEYAAVREAIQQLTTLDSSGKRRDMANFTLGDMSVTYYASQLSMLQDREIELARRLSIRNIRKRTLSSFDTANPSLPVI